MELFTIDSLWTQLHGIVLGGGALLGLGAILFALYALKDEGRAYTGQERPPRTVGTLGVAVAVLLWLTVIGGTYVVFPPYRATPPDGTVVLSEFPRAFITSNPEISWLHYFAMETKEHLPWVAAMLGTAFAFVATRHRRLLWSDDRVRGASMTVLIACFLMVAYVALLGVWVNKVAPVQ